MFPELVLLEVDYLKYDNCYSWSVFPEIRYQRMHDALNKTGRPIFFSMCEWGQFWPEKWAAPIANSWRTTGDNGLFMGYLFILTMFFIGAVISFGTSVVFTGISMIIIQTIGLTFFGWSLIITITLIGLIVSVIIKN